VVRLVVVVVEFTAPVVGFGVVGVAVGFGVGFGVVGFDVGFGVGGGVGEGHVHHA